MDRGLVKLWKEAWIPLHKQQQQQDKDCSSRMVLLQYSTVLLINQYLPLDLQRHDEFFLLDTNTLHCSKLLEYDTWQ